MVFSFLPCSTMCIAGQTGCGKTRFVYRLLKNVKDMYGGDPPDSILYCYGIHQPLFDEIEKTIPNITFHKGLPTVDMIDEFSGMRRHRLVILDDLQHRVVQDVEMELLFTQGSHHRKLSVLFLAQNVYIQGSRSRTIALNTTYLVLMKNVRDASQIATLGRQLFPGRSKILMESYRDATFDPFGYLVVDMSPHSEDQYRLRTHVFPGEDPVIYVPKNDKRATAFIDE